MTFWCDFIWFKHIYMCISAFVHDFVYIMHRHCIEYTQCYFSKLQIQKKSLPWRQNTLKDTNETIFSRFLSCFDFYIFFTFYCCLLNARFVFVDSNKFYNLKMFITTTRIKFKMRIKWGKKLLKNRMNFLFSCRAKKDEHSDTYTKWITWNRYVYCAWNRIRIIKKPKTDRKSR